MCTNWKSSAQSSDSVCALEAFQIGAKKSSPSLCVKTKFFGLLALTENGILDDGKLCIDVVAFNLSIDPPKGRSSFVVIITFGIIGY